MLTSGFAAVQQRGKSAGLGGESVSSICWSETLEDDDATGTSVLIYRQQHTAVAAGLPDEV